MTEYQATLKNNINEVINNIEKALKPNGERAKHKIVCTVRIHLCTIIFTERERKIACGKLFFIN